MKKILKQLFIISCLIISYSSQTLNVYAYTIPKTSTHAVEVLLKANVPTDYTEKFEIAIYNEVTEETILTEYMQENNYCSEVLLPNKCTYHFMMMFQNEDYKSDIVESIKLNDETSIEITFNITAREISNNNPKTDAGVIIGLENHTHSEEINTNEFDENTGLKTADTIYNEFIEKTSFLKDPANYNQSFLLVYTTDMEKDLYLKYTNSGSEEKWNAMSDYEKFIYSELSLSPYLEIVVSNENYKNEDEFIGKAYDIETANFYNSMIPNRGEEVRGALEKVWRWQYNYYQKNCTVYDFYNDKPWSDIMNTPTLQVQQMLEEIDQTTGLKTPDTIYNEFLEKTSFLEDPSNYNDMFLLAYTSDAAKEAYIKNTTNGNDESWNAMSEYEKFIYKELSSKPYLKIMVSNDTYKDIDEFMKEAYDIEIVSYYYDGMIPNRGQEVLDALEEVWRWQYNYFQITGTFFDFYEYKYGDTNKTIIESKQKVTEISQELEDVQEEIMNNLTKEEQNEIMSAVAEESEEMDELESNNVYDYLKDNFVIIILVAAIIILLFYIFINKRVSKNNKN